MKKVNKKENTKKYHVLFWVAVYFLFSGSLSPHAYADHAPAEIFRDCEIP